MDAESGDLVVELKPVLSLEVITNNVKQIINHPPASKKKIEIDAHSVNLSFKADTLLLNRIITNMLKNALEATPENGKVVIGNQKNEKSVVFWVHNFDEMSREVKLQVFQRSFSTKGANRGLGTYSIKLLGEKYLKGKTYFRSEKGFGTRFYLELPLS